MSSDLHSVVQMHCIQQTAVSLTGLQMKMRIKLGCPGRHCVSGSACCYENRKPKGTKERIYKFFTETMKTFKLPRNSYVTWFLEEQTTIKAITPPNLKLLPFYSTSYNDSNIFLYFTFHRKHILNIVYLQVLEKIQ